METVAGELSKLVAEFVPATVYNCSLSARTSAGFGVNDTVQVLTSKCKALYTNGNVGICPNLFHAQCQIDQKYFRLPQKLDLFWQCGLTPTLLSLKEL